MSTRRPKSTGLAFEPDYAVPPGRTLLETIQTLGLEQKELSQRTGYSEKHISQIVRGKDKISPEAALRFEQVTGVPARLWNQLESQYQEQLAKLNAAQQQALHLDWLESLPYKELAKRGVIAACDNKIEYLQAMLSFFRVATVEAWYEGWADHCIAFRKSTCVEGRDAAIAAWVQLAQMTAERMECQSYSDRTFRAAIREIRELTVAGPEVFVPRMKTLCADAGVALALVPELPKAPVSGAARWLSKAKAMIALNLRGKANDRFWFTFFHEAGHILNDDRKEVFVDIQYADNPCEQKANEFAAEVLIPANHTNRLIQLKSRADIESFAAEIGVHPGIVVGRLQHLKVINFSELNHLKAKLTWA